LRQVLLRVGDLPLGAGADGDRALLGVLAGTRPVVIGEPIELVGVAGPEGAQRDQRLAGVVAAVVALDGPGLLVVGDERRVLLFDEAADAEPFLLDGVAQVADELEDRPGVFGRALPELSVAEAKTDGLDVVGDGAERDGDFVTIHSGIVAVVREQWLGVSG